MPYPSYDERYRIRFLDETLVENEDFEFSSGIDSADSILDADLEIRLFADDESDRARKYIQHQGPSQAELWRGLDTPPVFQHSPPSGLETTPGFNRCLLKWKEGTRLSGLFRVEYITQAAYNADNTAAWTLASDEVIDLEYLITGLAGNTGYKARVDRGGDERFGTIDFTTGATPITRPTVERVSKGTTSIVLRLSGGTRVGNGVWHVQYRAQGISTWSSPISTGSTANPTQYRLQVTWPSSLSQSIARYYVVRAQRGNVTPDSSGAAYSTPITI